MMHRLFSLILVAVLLLPVAVLAEESTNSIPGRIKSAQAQTIREQVKTRSDAAKAALEEFKTATEAQRLAKLKAYGLRLIEHRLEAISKQEDRISTGKCKTVDAVIRAAINDGLADVETNLNAQKTALNAATTLEEAKTIVQNIIKQNRVFIHLLPAANGACMAQRLIALIDGKITDAVNKLEEAGIDTTAIETKMAAAKTDAQAAYDIYLAILKAPGNEGNKAKMGEAKALLQKVRKALGDIKSDIGNLTGEYRQKTSQNDGDTSQPD